MPAFDSVKLYAYLVGTWTDISAYWLVDEQTSVHYAISGNGPVDILADPGTMTFTLNNASGKFYLNSASHLGGWGYGTAVKLTYTYNNTERVRWYGRVRKLEFSVALVTNADRVTVTAMDWMNDAQQQLIPTPTIELNKTADYAIRALVNAAPIKPQSTSLDVGDSTFLTIFDNDNIRTVVYDELAKFVNSEWGYCYIRHAGSLGDQLVFEKSSNRGVSRTVKAIPAATTDSILLATSSHLLLAGGGRFLLNATESAVFASGTSNFDVQQGKTIVNRLTVTAYPKRIDTEETILYQLDNPIYIEAYDTYNFRAEYRNQAGGGQKISAIASSMITPEVPGATNPYLMTLLHFEGDATDSTGRHYWSQNDVSIENNIYKDGYGNQYVSSSILGKYALFGGYSNYKLTTPSGADFDFGYGPWTINWWELRINPASGAATVCSNYLSATPAFVLGLSDGANLTVNLSSDGATPNIASGRSLGPINVCAWTHYEVSCDGTGWYRTFANGQLIEKWYSALPLAVSANALSIGYYNSVYTYMALDEFCILKGQCLHKSDFTPPKKAISTTLQGDYQFNSLSDGTGSDYSGGLEVTAVYDSAGIGYSAYNSNIAGGYLISLKARGKGVYQYNPISDSANNAESQAANGYRAVFLQQRQQQDLAAGIAKATSVVANEGDEQTEIITITFSANYSTKNMYTFLTCDVGDLIQVTYAPLGITNRYYYIQSVSWDMTQNFVKCTYGLRRDFAH